MSVFNKVFRRNRNESSLIKDPREPIKDNNLLFIITLGAFVLLYGLSMIFSITGALKFGAGWLTSNRFFDLFNENAHLILMVCGLSVVMIGGGIDISVAAVANFTSMVCAVMLRDKGFSVTGALFLSMAIGLAFGVLNGFLVSHLKLQPFIVTLASMFLARGATTMVSKSSVGARTPDLVNWQNAKLAFGGGANPAALRLGALIAIIVVVLVFVVLRWSKFGRKVYAVGGNSQNALNLGVNPNRTKLYSYLLCGLLAGLAGFAFLLKTNSGEPNGLPGMEMDAIASAIIGGILLTGGVGNIFGALFGVLTIKTIELMVPSFGLAGQWWKGVMIGIMLCLFIVLQSVILGVRNRRRAGNQEPIIKKFFSRFKRKKHTEELSE